MASIYKGLLPLLLAVGNPLDAQSIAAGLRGGWRGPVQFQGAAVGASRQYAVGPMIRVGLRFGFGIEFDALYSRQGYSNGWGTPLYTSYTREADNVWEFPLLARYQLPGRLRLYPEIGWAPRLAHGFQDFSGSFLTNLNPATYTASSGRRSSDWPTAHGLVAGGGLQIPVGRLRLASEIRYTHWNQPVISGFFPDGPGYGSSQNQIDVLLGIAWQVRGGSR